jgi:phytoene synthase
MSVSSRDGVEEAFRHCREVTRRRARNFYYGLKLAPEPQRSALYAVYAWMRRADDLVDGVTADGALQRMERFRAETDDALRGRPGADPLWRALAETAARFHVDGEVLHAMVDGQIDDLLRRRYETFEQLLGYCRRVASSVGLVCIDIWGCGDESARTLAVDRGIAFQLTNVLRDYKEDYDAGRMYLPAEDFRRHSISPADLRRWSDPRRCRRFVLEQCRRAASYYAASAPLDRLIAGSFRPTLWAMTSIYRGLLRKVERAPRRIVGRRRLRLSSAHKGFIALRARILAAREASRPAECRSGNPRVGRGPVEDRPGRERRRAVSTHRCDEEEARRRQAPPQPAEAGGDSCSGSEA